MMNALGDRDQVESDAVRNPRADMEEEREIGPELLGHEVECAVPHKLFALAANVGARAGREVRGLRAERLTTLV
jgi:hypothetical protein